MACACTTDVGPLLGAKDTAYKTMMLARFTPNLLELLIT
jgi:hypothetical protein